MDGFANPGSCSLLEEWGARAVIAVNPGVDIHWGTCTTIWGSPDLDDLPRKPAIAVVAVNNPDGQEIIAAARAGESATVVTEMMEGWYRAEDPGRRHPGRRGAASASSSSTATTIPGTSASATTPPATRRCSSSRASCGHRRGKLRRSVRIAWWPGHSTGRYAGSTWFADAFAIDLDENCVAQINCDSPGCRWATSYHQTTCMAEARPHVDARRSRTSPGRRRSSSARTRPATTRSTTSASSSYYMLSSTMPDDLRAEKDYYAVSGCGGNIAWHTENDTLEIADRGILETDIRIYLLSVLAPRQRRDPAGRLARDRRRVRDDARGL